MVFWAIGMAGLIGFSVYETIFSPSFMMQFVTAGVILCTLSELLYYLKKGIYAPRDVLFLIGSALAIPAVIMYATGDDMLFRTGMITVSAGLAGLVLIAVRGIRGQEDILSSAASLTGFLAAGFTFLCGFTNTWLLFYAIVLALLLIIRLRHSLFLERSGERKVSRKRNLTEAIVLMVLIAVIGISFHDSYSSKPLRWLIATLGHGPEVLYENEGKDLFSEADSFLPGAKWLDTAGKAIQAHGGQVQRMPVPDGDGMKECYVWVGEDKTGGHFGNPVAVYTSEDLHAWEFRGDVLRSVESREALDTDPYFTELYQGCTPEEKDEIFACINTDTVMERPKMLYNEGTGQYVIWFHSDDATEENSYKYDVGMAGIAVSDSPFGPFRFLRRQRLSICPEGQIDCFPASKGEARDMNLFRDADGTGYIVYTSENNKTLYISKLDEAYTDLAGTEYGTDYIRLYPGAMREAPVLFRGDNGRYYLLSSSTTGWMSNQARLWSADEIFGKWKNEGNPFSGAGENLSFDTQCTSVFKTESGQWIYYGDRWNQNNLPDSRYVWLPLQFENGQAEIRWETEWE